MVMICTLSSGTHWQQASKFSACGTLSSFGKIEVNAPINGVLIIIIIIIIIIMSLRMQVMEAAAVVCPPFRYKYFPNRRGGVAGFGMAPSSRRRPDDNGGGGRHAWGQGQQLGEN